MSFDHGQSLVIPRNRFEPPKSVHDAGPHGIATISSARSVALYKGHDGQSEAPGSLLSSAEPETPQSLDRRGLPNIPGMTYRFLEVYAINPIISAIDTLEDDVKTAYQYYLQSLDSIKADHPPLFRLSLHYGFLNLDFECRIL